MFKKNNDFVEVNEPEKLEITFTEDLEETIPNINFNNSDPSIINEKNEEPIKDNRENIAIHWKRRDIIKDNIWKYWKKIKDFILSKYWKNRYDILIYELRDSFYFIIIFILSILSIFFSYYIYSHKSEFSIISKYYEIQNSIRLENEKLRANQDMEVFAEALKFWVKQNEEFYPNWWYLYNFDKLFPNDISELNILTFIEWWSSDFVEHDGRKIRIDNDIIESFQKQDNIIDNWKLKWLSFNIKLNWDPKKVNDFLYNLKYNNKIPKDFKKINKTFNQEKNLLEIDMDIVFYISK